MSAAAGPGHGGQPQVNTNTIALVPPTNLATRLMGRVLGNHRLVTELGSGGMGHVFYAEHLVIGRRAAIKVLKPEVSRDESIVARFLNEARAVNEIRHPNVIEITDIGREGDLHYIIMNFLEGETLGERLEREKILDEDTVLRITRQVVSALTAAHEHHIIHRDLKPDNIFITNHPDFPDYVKLLDFGIAKLIHRDAGTPGLTAVGTVLGTPWYMSPEQCRGVTDVDARSDMYSLAVVLYQALTGHVPFTAEQPMDVLIAQCTQPPVPAIEKNRKLSSHVNVALMRALEKEPDRRFSTMKEFWQALSNTRDEVAVPKRSQTPATGSGVGGAPSPRAVPLSDEDRGAQNVASTLTEIIKARLASDRLVLPAMPAIAVECLRVIKDPRQTFKTVGAVIARDPLLSSRILKMANSAAFPGLSPATSLEAAVARMGIDGLTIILVQFSLYQAFTSKDERIRASFRGIWEHSLAVALIAKDISVKLGSGVDSGTTYLAGLLHDVGKPVVASMLAEAEKQISKAGKGAWVTESVWRKIVAECHRPVGILLAGKWNLPREISRALEGCNAFERSEPRSAANIVCVANALAKRSGLYIGDVDQGQNDLLIATAPGILGLPADVIDGTTRDIFARVATMLDGGTGKNARPGR